MWDASKFDEHDFWEKVSTNRESKIEWYCDYGLVENELKKDITSKNLSIFIPGGGYSTFACELAKRGHLNIIHSDFVVGCIDQMKTKYQNDYPAIKFRICDVLGTSYDDKSFDIIVDKALFDSFCCENTEAHRAKSETYLKEMARILRPNGKFIVISLGQPFVLSHLLKIYNKYFISVDVRLIMPKNNDPNAGKPHLTNALPIVYLVFSHRNQMIGDSTSTNIKFYDTWVDSVDQILIQIKHQQEISYAKYICNYTKDIGVIRIVTHSELLGKNHFIVAESHLDSSQVEADYLIVMLDEVYKNDISFYMDEGIKAWARKHQAYRVCFVFAKSEVFCGPNKQALIILGEFATEFQYMLANTNNKVKIVTHRLDHIPLCINYPVKCLSTAMDNLSEAEVNKLHTSDAFVVTRDNVFPNPELFTTSGEHNMERHLVFRSNPLTVQSAVRVDVNDNIFPDTFTSEYYWAILILLTSIGCDEWKVVCMGLGGGKLTSFISKLLPIKSIESVEVNETVAKLAREYFGFEETPTRNVVIREGVEYILSMEPNSVDCIIYDVNNDNYEVDITCPLPAFIEDHVLDHVSNALTLNGAIILNVVTRTEIALKSVLTKIRNKFPCVFSYLMKREENVVIVAFKSESHSPIKVDIAKLVMSDKFSGFRHDEMFKAVLKYLISKSFTT